MENDFTIHEVKTILSRYTPETKVPPNGFKPASVLIPFYPAPDGLSMIFMKRPDYPGPHGGQISFPGGSKDREDEDDLSTALRETEEEIGVERENVDVWGALNSEYTEVSRYWVTPFVGMVPYPTIFALDEKEVERLIIIPLSHLMDKAHFSTESYVWKGFRIPSYQYMFGEDVIWGLTARILFNFFSLLSSVKIEPGDL